MKKMTVLDRAAREETEVVEFWFVFPKKRSVSVEVSVSLALVRFGRSWLLTKRVKNGGETFWN